MLVLDKLGTRDATENNNKTNLPVPALAELICGGFFSGPHGSWLPTAVT